eukprot:9470855-Pyramimonas_sp.AAC.1
MLNKACKHDRPVARRRAGRRPKWPNSPRLADSVPAPVFCSPPTQPRRDHLVRTPSPSQEAVSDHRSSERKGRRGLT